MGKKREINPHGLYHVYNRGNNKENIFIDSEDKFKFLSILKKKLLDKLMIIYSYCIMDNHYHLFLDDLSECLSDIMRDIQARYAEYFNEKYKRSGHVFQSPFGSCVVRGYSYSIRLIRYILRNPVKADIVDDIISYYWSSAGKSNKKIGIVDPKFVEIIFDNANVDYSSYINNGEEDKLIAFIEKHTFRDKEANIRFNEILANEFGITPESLLKQEKDYKMTIIMRCRYEGISVRQLVDISKISISFIRRATPKDIEYI